MTGLPLLAQHRQAFHAPLLRSLLVVDAGRVPFNADSSNKFSVAVAQGLAQRLNVGTGSRVAAQSAGNAFEEIVADFLRASFVPLHHLRPGQWEVRQVSGRSRGEVARFAQYSHLAALQEAAAANPVLAAALGNDYAISPDVVITRGRESDEHINSAGPMVDAQVATRADLRQTTGADRPGAPLLHASISTKWTLRSDRAQNARSEALNLIRNRKGRQPHIVVVVGEPTPSRLSSLALGTGDIDCVYHFALPELLEVVGSLNNSEAVDLLAIMVEGRRLKDIADLPLDLAV